MKKALYTFALLLTTITLASCSPKETDTEKETGTDKPAVVTPVVETFDADYTLVGTTSSGEPKNDTFIFKGETTDGVITDLTFDIVRNKDLEGEYSKTDIMGYMMNVTDGEVKVDGDNVELVNLTSYGYHPDYAEGASAQFGVSASLNKLSKESTFKDLTFTNLFGKGEVALDKALIAYTPIAKEAGVQLTEETLVSELLKPHGLFSNDDFVAGSKRVSYEGVGGGRSYGEQINAIKEHILDNKMTLEDVLELFKTANQSDTSAEERDTVAGATIAFVSDFQRMVYKAIHGELFEGVLETETVDGVTTFDVVTAGYGGDIETIISFNADKELVGFEIRDSNETENIGAKLTAKDSDFIKAILENKGEVDTVSGATKTSDALNKAIKFALEEINK